LIEVSLIIYNKDLQYFAELKNNISLKIAETNTHKQKANFEVAKTSQQKKANFRLQNQLSKE
jgi:hypothetical protein